MNSGKMIKIAGISIATLVLLALGVYGLVMWEGSSAREDAPILEASIAQRLLHYTVPAEFRAMKNPVDVTAGSADVEAGHQVYTQKCEICHAYDGGGKSEIGSGEYPRPPDLRLADVQRMSDGEIFYHLKMGIRHTGMPAWTLPDRKLWQVSAYLRNLPRVAVLSPQMASEAPPPSAAGHYVGSAACKDCHTEIYDRWKKTRMANVVQDPQLHPGAILPDLSKPDVLFEMS